MFRTARGFDRHTLNPRNPGGYVTQFFNFVLGLFIKLFFGVMALLFAVSLVVAGLVYLAFASVRFLITGRKPAVAVMFTQFRQYQRSAADGVWPAPRRQQQQTQQAAARDVVDVEVREIDVNRQEESGAAKPEPEREPR